MTSSEPNRTNNSAPPKNPALEYVVLPHVRMAIVTYHAHPHFDEWRRTMQALLRESAFERGFAVLLDRRPVAEPVSAIDLHQMIRFLDQCHAEGSIRRWAALVGDTTSFGMGRMAEQISAHDGFIRAFRDAAEAEDWLLAP